jgi:hypothetical protein
MHGERENLLAPIGASAITSFMAGLVPEEVRME